MTKWYYSDLMKALKTMDEKQLLELFHDLESIKTVERIADCAYQYLENCEGSDIDENATEQSEQEEWKDADDEQRIADIKSTERSIF